VLVGQRPIARDVERVGEGELEARRDAQARGAASFERSGPERLLEPGPYSVEVDPELAAKYFQ